MKIAILTNEYPPHVYGGAGVHVEYLTQELSQCNGSQHSVQVLCFGNQNIQGEKLSVTGIHPNYNFPAQDQRHKKFLNTMFKNILMSGKLADVDVVHCHTWYTHFAGLLLQQLNNIPLVLTTHSLEPHRPWKIEQLGTAYHASSWIEKTAYQNANGVIAVSESMKKDVQSLYQVQDKKVQVIHNGIDLKQYQPTFNKNILMKYKINPSLPFILFVGRITRQKGIIYLVHALQHIQPGTQIVLCAGAPDTEQIKQEMEHAVEQARKKTKNPIIWISKVLPKDEIIVLYSHASIFVCPSIYEPFGIINLEAMACKTPVIGTAVGGIPEIIVNGSTGYLVKIFPKNAQHVEPLNPRKFSQDLAESINKLLSSPIQIKKMGELSRKRVEEHFSWTHIAEKTLHFYEKLIKQKKIK